MSNEPTILINGQILDPAQAMLIRVAVTHFHMQVSEPDYAEGLGAIAKLYQKRANEVLYLLLAPLLILALALVSACGGAADDATAPDAGPCTCAFALCRSDGTCWCPTDAGTREECGPNPVTTDDTAAGGL